MRKKSRAPGSLFRRCALAAGGAMTMRHMGAAFAAVLVSTALPAWGQGAPGWEQKLPDGTSKEVVGNSCGVCHEFFSRVGAGYTADGWHTVVRMMLNQGANLPA